MSIPPPDRFGPGRPSDFGAGPERARRPVAPLSDPLVPADIRGWIERVIGVTRHSFVPLLTMQLGLAAVGATITVLLTRVAPVGGPDPGGLLGFLAMLSMLAAVALGLFAQCASMYVAVRDAANRPTTASEGIRFALGVAPTLLPWGLAATALTLFGFLLIVPGLYLAVVFGATLPGVLTIERQNLLRCFELVNRRLWPTAGRMLLALTAAGIYSAASSYIVSVLSTPQSLSEAALQAILAVPMGIVAVGITAVSYAELRFHEDPSVLTRRLADELDRPHSS